MRCREFTAQSSGSDASTPVSRLFRREFRHPQRAPLVQRVHDEDEPTLALPSRRQATRRGSRASWRARARPAPRSSARDASPSGVRHDATARRPADVAQHARARRAARRTRRGCGAPRLQARRVFDPVEPPVPPRRSERRARARPRHAGPDGLRRARARSCVGSRRRGLRRPLPRARVEVSARGAARARRRAEQRAQTRCAHRRRRRMVLGPVVRGLDRSRGARRSTAADRDVVAAHDRMAARGSHRDERSAARRSEPRSSTRVVDGRLRRSDPRVLRVSRRRATNSLHPRVHCAIGPDRRERGDGLRCSSRRSTRRHEHTGAMASSRSIRRASRRATERTRQFL